MTEAHQCARLIFLFFGFLHASHFECDAKIAGAGFGEDGAARFDRHLRWAEDAGHVAGKMLNEDGGKMRCGVGDGR